MATRPAGLASYIERSRSTRLPIRLALLVCGDEGGSKKQTCTLSLNAHGVLVALAATSDNRSKAEPTPLTLASSRFS